MCDNLKVIPDLRKEINSLQTQRAEADKTTRAQNLQARGTVQNILPWTALSLCVNDFIHFMPSAKMSLITRQLLGEAKGENLIQRCVKILGLSVLIVICS